MIMTTHVYIRESCSRVSNHRNIFLLLTVPMAIGISRTNTDKAAPFTGQLMPLTSNHSRQFVLRSLGPVWYTSCCGNFDKCSFRVPFITAFRRHWASWPGYWQHFNLNKGRIKYLVMVILNYFYMKVRSVYKNRSLVDTDQYITSIYFLYHLRWIMILYREANW